MISIETNEQEVQSMSTIKKNRTAPPNPTETQATPTVRRISPAWLLLPGGILAVAAAFVLLPPSVQVTKLATMPVYDEAVGVGYVQAKVPVVPSRFL